jgi:S-adenosylmethionine/arginine decarboxylase-like enzyme
MQEKNSSIQKPSPYGFGPHLTIDLDGCPQEILSNVELHTQFLKDLPELIGMELIMEPQMIYYDGGAVPEDSGPTGIAVIATSHISIHSFEKKGRSFLDIFSCLPFDTKKTLNFVKKTFQPKTLEFTVVQRGLDFPRRTFYVSEQGKTIQNLIGNEYGYLKVIARAPNRKSAVQWFCSCRCGHMVAVDSTELKKGTIKSCGCLRQEMKRGKPGEAVFQIVYRNYKRGAKDRNLEFSLNEEEFSTLIKANCWYCGVGPSNLATLNSADVSTEWLNLSENQLKYNGIDRKDNKRGYVPSNCLPCCKMCNDLKCDLDFDIFVEWINRCYANLESKHLISNFPRG